MNAKVTIRDVAQVAGVSIGTVSRALNGRGRVSAQAITTVARIAQELGYQPNALAQSMRTQSTQVIGLLVSDIANPLYAGIITAIEAKLVAAGYSLLLANTHGDANREKSLMDLFRRRRVDGLIVCPCGCENPEMLARLDKDLPVVSLDRDLADQGVGVHVDHHNGALQATRYLLNLGHRRIALLTPASALRPGRERIAGYLKAFDEQGIEHDPQLIRAESSAMEFSFSDSLALLSMAQPPTAFLCLGTRILAGVLQALRHAGRSIPRDVSVVSIGDTDLSQLFNPSITSLTWDLCAVGTACAELLLQRLGAQGRTRHARIVITTQMLLRESCGPSPTKGRSD